MKLQVTIEFSGPWLLTHRDDDVFPVTYLINSLRDAFPQDLTVKTHTLSEITLVLNADKVREEVFNAKLRELFGAKYPIEDIASLTVYSEQFSDEAAPAKPTEEKPEEKAEAKPEEKPQEKAPEQKPEPERREPKRLFDRTLPAFSGRQASKSEQEQLGLDGVMAEIEGQVGADEYKVSARELAQVAPQIIKNKTYDTFTYQSYLYSINDGYGLKTYLELFAGLCTALNVKPVASSRKVIMHVLPPESPDPNRDAFSGIRRILDEGSQNAVRILCVDISEWMNKTDSKQFKDFLRHVEESLDCYIVVFRIPFVEKDVLDRLRFSLNDLMTVRTVSFPPLTQEEIKQCAERSLKKYGFTISRNAWENFHERISEEKSDGRFYGLNTVEKVVRELLYKKQLANAKTGKSDTHITKRDTAAICATQDENISGFEMLEQLVGSKEIKARVQEIIAQIEMSMKNDDLKHPCIHMRFLGSPGTGKTTVARIIGKILREKGVLRVGGFYEYSGRDFCGRYIGETAPKTAGMCRDAYGSVLFIDEAYSLYHEGASTVDYGREALDTLIAEMENHRSDFVVIMAGYTDDMEHLMEGNRGLASRMPYVIEFPNFTRDQLFDVFISMVEKSHLQYDASLIDAAREYFLALPEEFISSKEFSNARFVRNLFERTWAKATMRCQLDKKSTITLTRDDLERSASEKEFKVINEKKSARLGF